MSTLHPANRPKNVLRRVDRARDFGINTCPASRHAHLIGEALIRGQPYPMLTEDPEHCGGTILSVVESLFKARSLLIRHGIDPWSGKPVGSKAHHRWCERRLADASDRFQRRVGR